MNCAAELAQLPPSPAMADPELPTPPQTPVVLAEEPVLPEISTSTATASAASALETIEEEEQIPHVRVEVPETTTGNGWEQLTQFIQMFVGHMETYIWPIDPLADVHPTMLPFLYKPAGDVPDDKFLSELLYLLTIGLQGQAFGWRYKMLFDVHWNDSKKGYMAELTGITKIGASHYPKPASEAEVTETRTD
jgi:hypothetical protein